ncbi:MAG: hypothetical protein MUF54_02505 [Polyangiaceae bacterium]|jgi:dolichol kinase|nr:hypothetical protein [Polyangiaceae bacterium]
MPTTLADDPNQVLLDVHSLLRDLDPARWRDEVEAKMRARLAAVQEQLSRLTLSVSWTEGGMAAARDRMAELSRVLREHAPRRKLPSPQAIRDEWMAFRRRATPAYEAVAATLRAHHGIELPSIRSTNYARSVFHAFSAIGSIALLEVVFPLWFLPWLTGAVGVICWTLEITRRRSERLNDRLMRVRFFQPIVHPRERHHVNSSTWYVTALFLLSLLQSHLIGTIALAVLGFADPMAAFIGRRWGSIKLVHGRSLQGSLTFLLVGTFAALGATAIAHPEVTWPSALWLAAGAALLAGLAELFSSRIDDNLTVPVSAAAGAVSAALAVGVPF